MHKIITKTLKKLFSSFGVAALAAVFAIAGTVFAATNWTTWTADMTVSDGDIMTVEKWNGMVNAIGELKSELEEVKVTPVSSANLINSEGMEIVTNSSSTFLIDRVNKKVYVQGNNTYSLLGMGASGAASYASRTENPWFSGKTVINILFKTGSPYGGTYMIATIKETNGTINNYIWSTLYYGGYGGGYCTSWFPTTTGMDYLGGTYGFYEPHLFTI